MCFIIFSLCACLPFSGHQRILQQWQFHLSFSESQMFTERQIVGRNRVHMPTQIRACFPEHPAILRVLWVVVFTFWRSLSVKMKNFAALGYFLPFWLKFAVYYLLTTQYLYIGAFFSWFYLSSAHTFERVSYTRALL